MPSFVKNSLAACNGSATDFSSICLNVNAATLCQMSAYHFCDENEHLNGNDEFS